MTSPPTKVKSSAKSGAHLNERVEPAESRWIAVSRDRATVEAFGDADAAAPSANA